MGQYLKGNNMAQIKIHNGAYSIGMCLLKMSLLLVLNFSTPCALKSFVYFVIFTPIKEFANMRVLRLIIKTIKYIYYCHNGG